MLSLGWGALLSTVVQSVESSAPPPTRQRDHVLTETAPRTSWMQHATARPSPAGLFFVLDCLKVEFTFFLACMTASLDQCRIPESLLSP